MRASASARESAVNEKLSPSKTFVNWLSGSATTTPIHTRKLQIQAQSKAKQSKAHKQNSEARYRVAVSRYRNLLPLSCPRRRRARFVGCWWVFVCFGSLVWSGLAWSGVCCLCLTLPLFVYCSVYVRARSLSPADLLSLSHFTSPTRALLTSYI